MCSFDSPLNTGTTIMIDCIYCHGHYIRNTLLVQVLVISRLKLSVPSCTAMRIYTNIGLSGAANGEARKMCILGSRL